ncbi:hypothetical protein NQ317_017180 [Molorchus minor]|uniref:Thioredoxin-like fold domain-containing protein n=1 Tax=Molorchus minor TaxID=1323400 RepID=A0ABQ9J0X3_9CUCU|nr:hypothetical protein NQ317_017180 [Molorchus minor]
MKYRSKKGQLPFIELNGEEIADSAIIIKELSQKFGHDLDAILSAEQRNLAHATISMIENHLAWVVMWWRTKYPDQVLRGYKVNLQHALGTRIPNGILNFFFKFAFGRKATSCTGIAGRDQPTILGYEENIHCLQCNAGVREEKLLYMD